MKTFVVIWNSVIGRSQEEGAYFEPVDLSFLTTVKAASKEEAQDMCVGYSDPTFTLRVSRVAELGEEISTEEVMNLLDHNTVFNVPETKKPTR